MESVVLTIAMKKVNQSFEHWDFCNSMKEFSTSILKKLEL